MQSLLDQIGTFKKAKTLFSNVFDSRKRTYVEFENKNNSNKTTQVLRFPVLFSNSFAENRLIRLLNWNIYFVVAYHGRCSNRVCIRSEKDACVNRFRC